MHLVSLQIGEPRAVASTGTGQWWDKDWSTGIIKEPVEGRFWLGYQGLEGDGCADTRVHGGVDKAICAYPIEHYPFWRESLGLPELPHRAFGENFTTSGFREDEVCVGDIFELGEVLLQISQPREPCWKPGHRWKVKDLAVRILETGYTGFYFRVLRHGLVQSGQPFKRIDRPYPEWNLSRCNQIMHHLKDDLTSALILSSCPALSGSWKDTLHARHRTSLQARS